MKKRKRILRRFLSGVLSVLFLIEIFSVTGVVSAETGVGDTASGYQTMGALVRDGGHIYFDWDDPSVLKPVLESNGLRKQQSEIPSTYDLRDYGYVTSVKDQNPYGTCWAFGAISSAESGMLMAGTADQSLNLSERQLAWYAYNGANDAADSSLFAAGDTFCLSGGSAYDAGGSRWVSVPTLARRYGAADETKAPYSNSSMGAPNPDVQTVSDVHLEEVLYLPEPAQYDNSGYLGIDTEAMAAIKSCLMNSGAVSVGYHAYDPQSGDTSGDNGFLASENSYYYTGSGYANHEVTIVGWDDSFSKTRFATTPPGNGAWIIKNSWGSGWGADGYFYMSYYDHSISEPTFYKLEEQQYQAENTEHTYQNVYQYDGIGYGDTLLFSYDEGIEKKYANCFTMREREKIEAVGTYTPVAESVVHVEVYLNPTTADPASGTKKYETTQRFAYAGYHTIAFSGQAIEAAEGDVVAVSVSVKFDYEQDSCYLAVCEFHDVYGNYTEIDYSDGQSYTNENGSWEALCGQVSTIGSGEYVAGNALIKLLTNNFTPVPVLQGMTVSARDSAGTVLADTVIPEESVAGKIECTLPQATAEIQLSASLDREGRVAVTAGGISYAEGAWIPRTAFEESLTVLTTSEGATATGNLYTLSLQVPDTVLQGGNDVVLADSHSILPADAAFSAAPVTGGEIWNTVQTALAKLGAANITLFQLQALSGEAVFAPDEGQIVRLSFPVPAGSDPKKVHLYLVDPQTGALSDTGAAVQEGSNELSLQTTKINGLYALAAIKEAPPIPVLDPVVYDAGRTLAEISLPSTTDGTWTWDDPSTVPSVDVTSYPASFSATSDGAYYSYQAAIPLTVEQADAVIAVLPSASAITYGEPLSASSLSGGRANTPGSFVWQDPLQYPHVGNTGCSAVFLPNDTINYRVAAAAVSVPVAPKEITVSAKDTKRAYGDTNPTFDFDVPAGALVNGDTKSGLGLLLKSSAVPTSGAGKTFPIEKDASTNPDYRISVIPATLTIEKREISIRMDDCSISYGEAVPDTYSFTVNGLVWGDTADLITTNFTTEAADGARPGIYGIGGTAQAANYKITVVTGKLRILPAKPTIKAVSASYNSVKLIWNTDTGADGYYLYQKDSAGKWKRIKTISSSATGTYTHTGLVTGTSYTYTVKGYTDAAGERLYSAYNSSGVKATPVPATPSVKAVPASSTSIKISWNRIAGASGYYVYRQEAGSWKRIASIRGGAVCSYTDSGQKTGATVIYTVKAYRTVNGAAVSGRYPSGVRCALKLSTPAVKAVSASYNAIRVSWNRVNGAGGYLVYRRNSSGRWERIATVSNGSTLSYTDTRRTTGKTYTYTVKAYWKTNGKTAYGGYPSGVSCRAIPSTPALKNAVGKTTSSIQITWGTVTGAQGYYVYRKTGDTDWKCIGKVRSGSVGTFTDSHAQRGVSYRYTVRAYRNVNGTPVLSGYHKDGIFGRTK